MLIDQFKIGKKIGIFINRLNGVLEHDFKLRSQIADILSQNEFLILAPILKGKPVNLGIGDKLLITFAYGEDGLFVFEAETRELIVDTNGILLYRVVALTEVEKLQRREHFRMPLQVPIVYQAKKDGRDVYGQGLTCDISGGGVRFVCGNYFEIGDVINVFIRLEPDIDLRTQVEITRVETDGYKRYEVSAIFSLEFLEREKIIKHIFEIQREKLKKHGNLKGK